MRGRPILSPDVQMLRRTILSWLDLTTGRGRGPQPPRWVESRLFPLQHTAEATIGLRMLGPPFVASKVLERCLELQAAWLHTQLLVKRPNMLTRSRMRRYRNNENTVASSRWASALHPIAWFVLVGYLWPHELWALSVTCRQFRAVYGPMLFRLARRAPHPGPPDQNPSHEPKCENKAVRVSNLCDGNASQLENRVWKGFHSCCGQVPRFTRVIITLANSFDSDIAPFLRQNRHNSPFAELARLTNEMCNIKIPASISATTTRPISLTLQSELSRARINLHPRRRDELRQQRHQQRKQRREPLRSPKPKPKPPPFRPRNRHLPRSH
jgi:hypothetical protein